MRALVIGHFSTIGDIESLEIVAGELRRQEIEYDVLPFNPGFVPFIDRALRKSAVKSANYTHLIAVCGPFWPDLLARRGIALEQFAHCTRIGVNLTMIEPVETWNPFHVLLERDSSRTARPDITFLKDTGRVPVAGICVIGKQREYGRRQRHDQAQRLFTQLVDARELATIPIDTRWPSQRNSGGLRSPEEIISLIGRVDVLLTNRLHGMVYALKAGVPVIAVDPVLGGDKVMAQAAVLGWPMATTAEAASPAWMEETLDWCLSPDGRSAAKAVAETARAKLQAVRDELGEALRTHFDFKPVPPAPSAAILPVRLARTLWDKLTG